MNKFLIASRRLVARHGTQCTYTCVTEGLYDPETLSTTNVELSSLHCMFKNHIRISQYNYPNLVGKDAAEFYLVNNALGFKPDVKDKITCAGTVYTVDTVTEHVGYGDVVLYTMLAVRN
jgi:hypothetical protein